MVHESGQFNGSNQFFFVFTIHGVANQATFLLILITKCFISRKPFCGEIYAPVLVWVRQGSLNLNYWSLHAFQFECRNVQRSNHTKPTKPIFLFAILKCCSVFPVWFSLTWFDLHLIYMIWSTVWSFKVNQSIYKNALIHSNRIFTVFILTS